MLMSASSVTPALVAGSWTTLYSSGAYAVQWKIADSGDAAASNFPVSAFAGGSNTESCECVILRITGIDTTTPINGSAFTTGSTTTPSGTGITPATLQCLLLDLVLHQNATAARTVSAYAIASNNPSWTEIQDACTPGSSGTNNSGAAVASASQTAVGGVATGNVSATISGAVVSNLIGIIAVNPSVTTPSSVSSTAIVGTVVFVRKMLVSAVSSVASVGTAVMTNVGTAFSTLAKHAGSWTNLDKS